MFASLYNDRAISYRVHQGFDHADVALSAGVQIMVRSDLGASGVMFTLDTESGFRDVVFITASYGLGETVVQGAVNPDEFYLYKPALASGHDPILRRNRGSKAIEMVYSNRPGGGVETREVDECPALALQHLRRPGHRTGPAGADHRKPLRQAHGHRMGAGRRNRASSTSCRRGRKR